MSAAPLAAGGLRRRLPPQPCWRPVFGANTVIGFASPFLLPASNYYGKNAGSPLLRRIRGTLGTNSDERRSGRQRQHWRQRAAARRLRRRLCHCLLPIETDPPGRGSIIVEFTLILPGARFRVPGSRALWSGPLPVQRVGGWSPRRPPYSLPFKDHDSLNSLDPPLSCASCMVVLDPQPIPVCPQGTIISCCTELPLQNQPVTADRGNDWQQRQGLHGGRKQLPGGRSGGDRQLQHAHSCRTDPSEPQTADSISRYFGPGGRALMSLLPWESSSSPQRSSLTRTCAGAPSPSRLR